jgi:ABC-type multidrug transport system fused ATPase/permease subunit
MTSTTLLQDISAISKHLSGKRKGQLILLLVLMILVSCSEVLGVASIIPFLAVLENSSRLLNNERIKPILGYLAITTPQELLLAIVIVFIGITISTNVLRVVSIHVQNQLAARLSLDLSSKLYHHLLFQPYIFYTQHHSSELVTLMVFANNMAGALFMPGLQIITNSFVAIALFLGILIIDGKVAIAMSVILATAYIAIYNWRKYKLQQNSILMSQAQTNLSKVTYESLGNIKDIILSAKANFFNLSYQQSLWGFNKANADNNTVFLTPRYLIEMLAMTCIALLALSMGRGGDFSRSVPILGSLALAANRLLPALQQSFASVSQIQGYREQMRTVLKVLERSYDPLQELVPAQVLLLRESLTMQNVWFRYREDSGWVLQDLCLTIPAKSRVGFVGTTGSGKSTTADLILGLLKPEKGQILVDDLPLEGERLRAWQLGVAHVPQSIFIADTTVASNIAFGVPEAQIDWDRVIKAAKLAQIADFIESLPEGYHTTVGERGIRLSGGQRQRVGIARALYREAKVIVFDEATSALDNYTERELMSAIDSLSQELTIILIAHRLTTVEKCDRIFEFSQGRVIHSGTYEELLEKSESFRRMAIRE